MRAKVCFLSVAALVAAVAASPVYAQLAPVAAPTQFNRDISGTEVRNFDQFLDSHPEVAQRLSQNPALVDNEEFVEKHPALRDFLSDHPGVREELRESPGQFMSREGHFEWREEQAGMGRNDAAMDRYFDHHSEAAQALGHNPRLLDDNKWLGEHPQLAEYMKDHPQAREQLREHPYRFIHREQPHERGEASGR